MRFPLSTLIMFVLIQQSAAQQWIEHVDEERGIAIALPSEFKSTAGGLAYMDPSGDRGVIVWRREAFTTFETMAWDEVKSAASAMDIFDQSITPTWAAYSAIRDDGRRVDTRMIPACDGRGIAGFQVVYPVIQLADMKLVFERIATEFRNLEC